MSYNTVQGRGEKCLQRRFKKSPSTSLELSNGDVIELRRLRALQFICQFPGYCRKWPRTTSNLRSQQPHTLPKLKSTPSFNTFDLSAKTTEQSFYDIYTKKSIITGNTSGAPTLNLIPLSHALWKQLIYKNYCGF